MKKVRENIKGITLIALVITIIVLLILSTVTVQFLTGENGLIKRSIQAAFYTEMTSMEEQVSLYKMGNDNQIPVGELCKMETLSSGKRTVGEIGYYRRWYINNAKPSQGIFENKDDEFNSEYSGEFTNYPLGVQDLYYLDNAKIGIKSSNKYLIDVATGIIYKLNGVNLNGNMIYSLYMYKQMDGQSITPAFQEAEVSGSQLETKLAGNTDPNEPYGFQIIANPQSSNIFKLYNNGELYGKGIKGSQLNTSTEEMEKINAYKWNEWTLPDELKDYKQIVIGESSNIFLIDKNDDLWAIGENRNNMMGLSQEQQVEYTTREWIKLNVNGKKIKNVFANPYSVFVITQDNELYGAGNNAGGEIGINNMDSITSFTKIDFPKVDKIIKIKSGWEVNATVLQCSDNTFYFAGYNSSSRNVIGCSETNKYYLKFKQIWDGILGPDMDQDIEDYIQDCATVILKKDGTMWISGFTGYIGKNLTSEKEGSYTKYNLTNVKKIMKIYCTGIAFIRENNGEDEYWSCCCYNGSGTENANKMTKLNLPTELINEGVKKMITTYGSLCFLSNAGNLYGAGYLSYMGVNISSGATSNIDKLNIEKIESLYADSVIDSESGRKIVLVKSKNGKIYTTSNSTLMYQNKIIQQNWSKVADNVLYFDATGGCYIDRDNNLWVSGNNAEILGLGAQNINEGNIQNYIKCEDSNIKGKAVEAKISTGLIAVRLKDNSLWTSGYYNKNGTLGYPGWSEQENKTIFTKIQENVTKWSTCERVRTSISDGKIYGWGTDYGGSSGSTTSQSNIPIQCTNLPSELQNIESICKIETTAELVSYIITDNGKLYLTGNHSSAYWGGQTMTSSYSQYTYNLNLESDEKIKDMKWITSNTAIILTSKGNVYGFGQMAYLGINNTSTYYTETRKLPIENVASITSGYGFFIAIKNDGTVWGTGSNINGILGRWIGTDRNRPNIKYRTAYTWVECPELEI